MNLAISLSLFSFKLKIKKVTKINFCTKIELQKYLGTE
jgi:hypothetical protein